MKKPENNHITEYLDYYLSLKSAPGYAVLLKGEWGTGKSWFITQYMEGKSTHFKFLHVSLYGVASKKDIEDIFFEKIHPVLASKSMKFLGKLGKAALKGALEIDLNGDELKVYLAKVDSSILVFDDLERCSIEMQDLLGYINQFVENYSAKVIILANETEIQNRETEKNIINNSNSYFKVKEKVVGKTLEIKPDFEAAYLSFCKESNNDSVNKLLTEKLGLVKEVFHQAGYNNLRHLKYGVLDFNRFYDFLPEATFKKEELIDHILLCFFALIFELKKGAYTDKELFDSLSMDRFIAAKIAKEDNPATKLREKHPVFKLWDQPVEAVSWKQFFMDGMVERENIKLSIESSRYFITENTPLWMRFWHFYDFDDQEFKEVLEAVRTHISSGKIQHKYELVQIIGSLLLCSDWGLISDSKPKVLRLGKKLALELKKAGKLTKERFEDFPSESSHSLGYHGKTFPEFQSFINHLNEKIDEVMILKSEGLAEELLNDLKLSVKNFAEKITVTNSVKNIYFETPVLIYIKPSDFSSIVSNIANKEKKELAQAIRKRYHYPDINKKLVKELKWLSKVKTLLQKEVKARKGKLSGMILDQQVLQAVDLAIANLNSIQQPAS